MQMSNKTPLPTREQIEEYRRRAGKGLSLSYAEIDGLLRAAEERERQGCQSLFIDELRAERNALTKRLKEAADALKVPTDVEGWQYAVATSAAGIREDCDKTWQGMAEVVKQRDAAIAEMNALQQQVNTLLKQKGEKME